MEDFWSPLQTLIKQFCLNYDKHWQTRKRVIDTHFLVLFIFKLVLSKNKQGYKSLLNELWEHPEISTSQATPVAASSLCEARQKLPEQLFIEINKIILLEREKSILPPKWCGHNIVAIDGSKIHLPHELLSAGYKAPNKDQYYPQGLLSVAYNLSSGLIYDCSLNSNSTERYCAIEHMNQLSQGDVLVLDRGYFSYLILYRTVEKGMNLICRLSSGSMNKAVKAFWESNSNDTVVEYYPSVSVKREIKKQGNHLNFKPIKLRLFKYMIDNEMYVCATTLIGQKYPLNEFPHLYHARWGIEELYKISKEFIDVEDFHGKTERGVKQELYAHILLINIARIFESEANEQIPPKSTDKKKQEGKSIRIKESYWQDFCDKIQELKINFKNCLLVISRFIIKLLTSTKQEIWLLKMMVSISRVRQKIRPGRHYPRKSRKPYTKWKSSNLSKLVKA